jgi:hypothetical protein
MCNLTCVIKHKNLSNAATNGKGFVQLEMRESMARFLAGQPTDDKPREVILEISQY